MSKQLLISDSDLPERIKPWLMDISIERPDKLDQVWLRPIWEKCSTLGDLISVGPRAMIMSPNIGRTTLLTFVQYVVSLDIEMGEPWQKYVDMVNDGKTPKDVLDQSRSAGTSPGRA